MKLNLTLTRRSYAVEIPVDQFVALTKAEDKYGSDIANNTIADQIRPLLRAGNVEYNGHFGNFIYFDMDVDEDTPEMQVHILGLIEAQLAKLP